jgi:hypothetical protein
MSNSEKMAEIEETESGDVRITLSDPDGELDTLRVLLSPESAYRLGEALCMKALTILRGSVVDEATKALRDEQP